jgi:hypothetical protein
MGAGGWSTLLGFCCWERGREARGEDGVGIASSRDSPIFARKGWGVKGGMWGRVKGGEGEEGREGEVF